MARRSLQECRIIELPKIPDARGNLTFIENHRHIPFEIKRVYYLYDVPGGSDRAHTRIGSCTSSSLPCRGVSTSSSTMAARNSAFI